MPPENEDIFKRRMVLCTSYSVGCPPTFCRLVLQKGSNLLIIVSSTEYNGYIALVSRKDSKLIGIQGKERSRFRTSQVVLGLTENFQDPE
jgi:hypothetical protein